MQAPEGRLWMVENSCVPGAAGLYLIGGLPLLRPDERVFTAMLDGWRNQQLARGPGVLHDCEGSAKAVRAFTVYSDAFPWTLTPHPGPGHRMNTDHLNIGHYQYPPVLCCIPAHGQEGIAVYLRFRLNTVLGDGADDVDPFEAEGSGN